MVVSLLLNSLQGEFFYLISLNVTGPAKIGHVGTNYTLSHTMPYFSTAKEYFHSVTCIVKPTKCLISAEKFIATELWNTKLRYNQV